MESKGYIVDCASNGEEALILLNSRRATPDVILVDLRMPVMDGLAFLNLQRSSSRFKDIPTVIMSADEDVEATCLKTNSTQVLMKPLTMASVITAVERNLRLH